MSGGVTIGQLVSKARRLFAEAGLDDPATDARMLVGGLLHLSSTELLSNAQEAVDASQETRIDEAIGRRLAREPVHRILGEREFYGLPLRLSAETLEPRPDTEILVDAVLPHLARLAREHGPARLLDLGTGTGAIVLALLKACPGAIGIAADISTDALVTAASNAERNGLADRLTTVQSNWFETINGRFHAIVSNPPYISSNVIADLEPEVRLFDPIAALDGGNDGLDAYRAIAKDGARFLHDDGIVGLEIGYDQRADVTGLFQEQGFALVEARQDYGGNDRALIFALRR